MYKTEVEQHQRSLDKYIADGRDEYDIKNQVIIIIVSIYAVLISHTSI